jgi:hypothetical protein
MRLRTIKNQPSDNSTITIGFPPMVAASQTQRGIFSADGYVLV